MSWLCSGHSYYNRGKRGALGTLLRDQASIPKSCPAVLTFVARLLPDSCSATLASRWATIVCGIIGARRDGFVELREQGDMLGTMNHSRTSACRRWSAAPHPSARHRPQRSLILTKRSSSTQPRNGEVYPISARGPAGDQTGVLRSPSDDPAFQQLCTRLAIFDTDEEILLQIGTQLFNALFSGEIGKLYAASPDQSFVLVGLYAAAASNTSRTLRANAAGVNGLERKFVPGSSRP